MGCGRMECVPLPQRETRPKCKMPHRSAHVSPFISCLSTSVCLFLPFLLMCPILLLYGLPSPLLPSPPPSSSGLPSLCFLTPPPCLPLCLPLSLAVSLFPAFPPTFVCGECPCLCVRLYFPLLPPPLLPTPLLWRLHLLNGDEDRERKSLSLLREDSISQIVVVDRVGVRVLWLVCGVVGWEIQSTSNGVWNGERWLVGCVRWEVCYGMWCERVDGRLECGSACVWGSK